MKHFFIISFFLLLATCSGWTQSNRTPGSAEMYQSLRKLKVLGSVLYVAAHPDDENTRLITWLSKDRLYRTGYLSLTRGDGGQNLIGEEQGIELGLIRTQELLAARRIDGGEQFFTRAFDFGYSKNPDETFRKWDKEKILSDVVWVIRNFRPDIIITRFPTTGEGGHGHHTASAILANEAFSAAADPARFPEQLRYTGTWQAKRVLWNTFNFGGNNTTREDQFKVDVGGYNPLLGRSYGEIAAESRSQHKSQGFGVPASRGESWEYFRATRGEQPSVDLLEGNDLSWARVPGGAVMIQAIDSVINRFDFLHPEASVPGLVQVYKKIKQLPAHYWQIQKLKEVEELIFQCSGFFAEAVSAEPLAVQTDSLRVSITLNNRLGAAIRLKEIRLAGFDTLLSKQLEKNRNTGFQQMIFIPATQPLTQPYWLEEEMAEGYFTISNPLKAGQADTDPALQAAFVVETEGETFRFQTPVRYKFTDPVKGELYQPLVVVPPVIISPGTDMQLVTPDRSTFNGTVTVRGMKKGFTGTLKAAAEKSPGSLSVTLPRNQLSVTGRDQVIETEYNGEANAKNDRLRFMVRSSNDSFAAVDKHEIRYDHIPRIHYFHPAQVQIRFAGLKTHHRRIGYITGAGDKVPEALEQMGFEVTLLGDKELSKNNLAQYDAILTGVRAYNTHDWLNRHYEKLMKYVSEGGNLIVQYNTSNQIGPVRAKIGPYPFTITRTRVTDETAPVTLLKPDHPVFNFPNRISADDFTGWIQERSIYHASDTSGKFEKLIGMADPGERSDDGSLLIARYGKGWFTYTGIVFFRELPAGVPGAYRLLANLIALNRKKGF